MIITHRTQYTLVFNWIHESLKPFKLKSQFLWFQLKKGVCTLCVSVCKSQILTPSLSFRYNFILSIKDNATAVCDHQPDKTVFHVLDLQVVYYQFGH